MVEATNALWCEKQWYRSPKPTERGIIISMHVNPQDQVIDCWSLKYVLWGSGSTLLFTSPWKEQQPEETRANRTQQIQALVMVVTLICPQANKDLFLCLEKQQVGHRKTSFLYVFLFISKLAVRTYFPGEANFCSGARNSNEQDFFIASKWTYLEAARCCYQWGGVKTHLLSWMCPSCVHW